MRKIKWGIAGLGNIAHRFAMAVTQHSSKAELYAVAARDAERANLFCQQYGANHSYESYQHMAKDPEVDAVYIATVHPYHKPLAELFIKHNKHVLVEKPAFTQLEDWLEMSALAKKHNVLLLEAMKTVTFPAYIALKAYLVEQNIQQLHVEAGFGNEHDYDPSLFIFNPELCGGASLDVGVYGLWLYYDLCNTLGSIPNPPSVQLTQGIQDCAVDTDACFTFTGSVSGKISASITRNLQRDAVLTGDGITIKICEKWWNPQRIEIEHNGQSKLIDIPVSGNGFEYEIDHFSTLLQEQQRASKLLRPETSQQVINTLETALIDCGFSHLTHLPNKNR